MDLTDEQWAMLEPLLLPDPPKRADGWGRQWRQAREVLDGVLWVPKATESRKTKPPPCTAAQRVSLGREREN